MSAYSDLSAFRGVSLAIQFRCAPYPIPLHMTRLSNIPTWLRYTGIGVAVAMLLLTAVFAQQARRGQSEGYSNDALQFWCAGHLIREGRSPWDIEGQASISKQQGWDRETNGIGRYDFMPYYYPYWVGLAAVPFTYLSFSTFTAAWTVSQYVALLVAAVLMCQIPVRFPKTIYCAAIVLFPLSTQAAEMGQVACGFLMLLALLWWFCERRWDVAAGFMLALLCTKPQLTFLVVPCVLIWSWRQQRRPLILSFLGGAALLVAVSTWMRPGWIAECLAAPSATRMLTGDEPWKLTTWNAVCRSLGIEGAWLTGLSAIVAIPAVAWALRTAWNCRNSLADIMAVGLLAVWFVSPYGRSYDMVVLLFPLTVLIGKCDSLPRTLIFLLVAYGAVMYQRIRWQRAIYPFWGMEIWWSWLPVLLAFLWIAHSIGWLTPWNPSVTNSSSKPSADSAQDMSARPTTI